MLHQDKSIEGLLKAIKWRREVILSVYFYLEGDFNFNAEVANDEFLQLAYHKIEDILRKRGDVDKLYGQK